MTSLGVWKVSSPFPLGLRNPGLQNGSFLEIASAPKDGLAVSESGHSLKVQTEGPHLVSLGSGRLSTAITIHPLPEGRVFVGNPHSVPLKDVIIQGAGIENDHCFIDNNNGLVTIYPQFGNVSIDGVNITEPTCLSQGCILCLGRSNFFRFNNPKEAHLMKQAAPLVLSPYAPSDFIPVESDSNHHHFYAQNRSTQNHFMDSVDFVEKVSKFEYMSHSQAPPITSQDTPKYFVKEGLRILHSAPPAVRIHKGFSSDRSLKNPSPVARFFNPLSSKSGFSTPPPYLQQSVPKTRMSPQTTRLYSKTPDPVMMNRKSENQWSGRCTPTSPQVPVCRSHHVSVENLKACEHELHAQHQKAVQERLRDEEQERQERLRLEEILNLCAEYEEQAQKEKIHKTKLNVLNSRDHASSSSSGEFSALSSEPSVPGSSISTNTKTESNIEGYSSEDSRSNGAMKYPTLPAGHNYSKHVAMNGVKNDISPTYGGSYHTFPNRIKTNGSLPRDRGNSQLSPGSETQNYGVANAGNSTSGNGATMFVNQKAINSASSEDELCAILGNCSFNNKITATEENGPSSPCMGTAFLTYPQSPRTRIKTVAGQRDRGPEVYENKSAANELAKRKDLSLTLIGPENRPASRADSKDDEYSTPTFLNANLKSSDIGLELQQEICKLQKERQDTLQLITSNKQLMLACSKNEGFHELEIEHALISGELKDEEQLQMFEGSKFSEIQKKKMSLEQKFELTQQELDLAKSKVQQQEKVVENLQNEIRLMERDPSSMSNLSFKADELKAQMELLDIERKAFEDLEFQQLESQAHEEEVKEELGQEIECLKETIAHRQIKLSELSSLKQSLTLQMEKEKMRVENQVKIYSEQLRQEASKLELIDSKLKALITAKSGVSPISSPESSPRTSDSDVELIRNGVSNRQPNLGLDGNLSPRHRYPMEDRGDNCNSFHSFESESSSLTSSDTGGENGRRSEDRISGVDGRRSQDASKVHQKELALQSAYQDQSPLVNHHHENGNFEVKRREKPRAQRPLTRYLPIRNSEFDLRQHIESAGHQIELCPHVHLTPTSCHGYLHKLGGKWRTWKKRWFVFNRTQKAFSYYSDKGETKLRGGVYFQAIEEVYVDHLHSVKSPAPQCTFCVKTYDRIFYLMAPTPEAMRIWVDVVFTGAEGYLDFIAEGE